MKTKIIALLIALVVSAQAQPFSVDTTTTTIISGVTHYGDLFPVPWNKVNSNTVFFTQWSSNLNAGLIVVSNTATSNTVALAVVSLQVGTNTTALAALSALVNSMTNKVNNAVTNTGSGYTLGGTWTGDGTALTINGANLTSGTVNSNALDTATLAWLQSAFVPGSAMNFDAGTITSDGSGNAVFATVFGGLKDGGYSTGTAGYYPMANGSGGWTWTAPEIVPDSFGNGGTTLHLKASDNGSDVYIHVDSSFTITASGSL